MNESAQIALPVRRGSRSSTMEGLARFGLTARGFVYLVVGWLGLKIALGHHPHQANQRGALAEVAHGGLGLVLLWLVGLGLGAYALWRLASAAAGTPGVASGGERAKAAASGLVYAALCVSTFTFIAGTSRTSQSRQQQTLTARLMRHDLGRWLVAAIGLIVVGVGVFLAVEGATRRFAKRLQTAEMSPRTRRAVVRLGTLGSVARGVAFAVAGGLTVAAAVTFDPRKSTGLDGALRTLAGQTYGPWLVGALAVGLIAFGVYGFAEARWRRTR